VHILSPPLRYVPARVALLRDHLIRELTPALQRFAPAVRAGR